MKTGEKLTGIVEAITDKGWGIINSPAAKIYIHYVIEGEEVEYSIKEKDKKGIWAEVKSILKPSPHRIEVPCKIYNRCGGCNLLHIKYEHQLKYKKSWLIKNISEITNYPFENIKIIPSKPNNYRMRAKLKGREDGKIGFIEKGKTSVVELKECLLYHERINEFINIWNNSEKMPFIHQIDLLFNPTDKILYSHLSEKPKNTDFTKLFKNTLFSFKGEDKKILIKMGNFSYLTSPSVFFQSNLFLNSELLNTVEKYLIKGETAIDLYSGVGFFIPVLQKYFKKIYAVESNRLSYNLLKENFPEIKAYRIVSSKFSFPPADLLLIDPPRSGMDQRTSDRIVKKRYKRIIYISCSQKGFKKDLKILLNNGYKLKGITMIDLFPHTPYFETIALLEI